DYSVMLTVTDPFTGAVWLFGEVPSEITYVTDTLKYSPGITIYQEDGFFGSSIWEPILFDDDELPSGVYTITYSALVNADASLNLPFTTTVKLREWTSDHWFSMALATNQIDFEGDYQIFLPFLKKP
ncbi:MAG: hypothetical protein AAGD96_34655, partial [Chloroflexota bacterium]